jgi:hypothetical protein
MKSQIYLTALGLVLATSALGFATVGHLPSFHARETAPIRAFQPAAEDAPHPIRCYNGVKGEPEKLYRGWVCE